MRDSQFRCREPWNKPVQNTNSHPEASDKTDKGGFAKRTGEWQNPALRKQRQELKIELGAVFPLSQCKLSAGSTN
jgi:hypothetical protein